MMHQTSCLRSVIISLTSSACEFRGSLVTQHIDLQQLPQLMVKSLYALFPGENPNIDAKPSSCDCRPDFFT